MNPSIIHTFALAGGFLALFGSAEVMYHRFNVRCEISRKYVHTLTGFLTLLFPVLIDNHWLILLLCGSFALILVASLRFKLLPSINAIDRTSSGSILFPLVVYLSYLVQSHFGDYIFFYLPILILAISDPLAALCGKRWPYGKYTFFKDHKTLVGSSAFFLSAFLISVMLFGLMLDWTGLDAIILALVIAFATTLAEGISQNGYDNLTIPLVASTLLIMSHHLGFLPI